MDSGPRKKHALPRLARQCMNFYLAEATVSKNHRHDHSAINRSLVAAASAAATTAVATTTTAGAGFAWAGFVDG